MNTKFKIILFICVVITSFTLVLAKEKEKNEETMLKALTKISMESAEKKALAQAPGKVIESSLELENGFLVYSYDIKTDKGNIMEVQINAKNGKTVLLKEETEKEEAIEASNDKEHSDEADEDGERSENNEKNEKSLNGSIHTEKHFKLKKEAKISEKAAINSALKIVEGKVKEAELENEDGFLVYKISIIFNNEEWEVMVDAGNGKVLELDMED